MFKFFMEIKFTPLSKLQLTTFLMTLLYSSFVLRIYLLFLIMVHIIEREMLLRSLLLKNTQI